MTPAASATATDITFAAAAAAAPNSAVEAETTNQPHLSLSLSLPIPVAAIICPTMSHPSLLPPLTCFLPLFSFSLCLPCLPSSRFKCAVRLLRRGQCMTLDGGMQKPCCRVGQENSCVLRSRGISPPLSRSLLIRFWFGGAVAFGHPVANSPLGAPCRCPVWLGRSQYCATQPDAFQPRLDFIVEVSLPGSMALNI